MDVSDERTPERLARRCLDALASADGTNRLIILDNVESPDDLRDFIPRGEGLRVLATTTRRADWGRARWTQISVEAFEREQSIGMLLGRTNQVDRETADIIAELLGDLPVAVSQAAAMIKRTRRSTGKNPYPNINDYHLINNDWMNDIICFNSEISSKLKSKIGRAHV